MRGRDDELGNLTDAAHPAPGGQDTQGPLRHTGTKVTSAGRTTHEHDGQGRVVRMIRRTLSGLRRIWTYAWDADDRLTEAVTPDSGVWRYRYDVLGRRTAKWRVHEDGSVGDETRRPSERRGCQYDPDTASYLTPDPLGLLPAPNHHRYVDNPLRWTSSGDSASTTSTTRSWSWTAMSM